MPLTPIVAPDLFDRLIEYSIDVEKNKETSSPQPLDFCDNFYAQFFQNRMKHEIIGFGKEAKESAIRLRLDEKTKEQTVILLITWFEQYCDVRYDVFSEEYGGGTGDAVAVFHDYLEVLLKRILAWSKKEKHPQIEQKVEVTLSTFKKALESVSQ